MCAQCIVDSQVHSLIHLLFVLAVAAKISYKAFSDVFQPCLFSSETKVDIGQSLYPASFHIYRAHAGGTRFSA